MASNLHKSLDKLFSPLNRSNNKSVNKSRIFKRFSSAKFDASPYDLHRLEKGPATTAELTRDEALDYYKKMHVIRKMEQGAGLLYRKKFARGFCHLYTGQEAVAVGIKSQMKPQDTAITSYRCHAWANLMGNSAECIFGELAGNRTGCSRGKGGSMHVYAPNFYGGNAIVGAHVPLGTGIAFAHKYKEDGGVCVTVFGDGASGQGQVSEAMNQAKLLNLPVLYVIENNIYSMGTSLTRHSANTDLYTHGEAIPGLRMDGMDILSVREGAKFCFDYIRSGKGPLVFELLTYRYFGHSMSDPGTSYRNRDEIKHVRDTKDCIVSLKKKILSSGLATEDELNVIKKNIVNETQKALKNALKEKELPVEELTYDIYCDYKGNVKMPGYGKFLPHKNAGFYKACNK